MTLLPPLTSAQRTEALKKAAAVRHERAEILAALKDGRVSLREVLDRGDPVVGKIFVRRLLESLPGIGKVRAGQLMDSLGVSDRRRVQGLGTVQRAKLLGLFDTAR
ncbi:integration host factor, actinobacterial type [Streptomyces sp. NPDC005426]|uniref:integration host factor, actinobacterial type n=1 Tax=Streptomyces sp. NPDC005426 TaxID=3155344 RepID=UPI0033BBCD0D